MKQENHELNSLSHVNPLWWLWGVTFDWLTVFCALYFIHATNHHLAAYVISTIVIGARQHGLGLMAHDATHYSACKNRFVNDILAGILCFWPLGYSGDAYRQFHFNHHKHLGTPEDPEQIYKKSRKPLWDTPISKNRIFRDYIADHFCLHLNELFHVMATLKPISKRDLIGPLVMWSLGIGLCWHFDVLWIIAVWTVAELTSFWAISRIRIWTEHIGTTGSHRFEANWWQRFLFFPHNTWCHYEHHKFSHIPCHNLPKVRKLDNTEKIHPSFWTLFSSYH